MPKFELGQITATKRVHNVLKTDKKFKAFVQLSLGRFHNGDWGDICDEDKKVNEDALTNGGRLVGVYESWGCPTICIITDADRSATTILFSGAY